MCYNRKKSHENDCVFYFRESFKKWIVRAVRNEFLNIFVLIIALNLKDFKREWERKFMRKIFNLVQRILKECLGKSLFFRGKLRMSWKILMENKFPLLNYHSHFLRCYLLPTSQTNFHLLNWVYFPCCGKSFGDFLFFFFFKEKIEEEEIQY